MAEKFRRKLFDGRATPEEIWQKFAFPVDAQCFGCKARPFIAIRVYAEFKEMLKRDPVGMEAIASRAPDALMSLMLQTKWGVFLKIRELYACKACAPSAERAAAKHPSWCFADVHRPPEIVEKGHVGSSGWTPGSGSS